MNLNKRTFSLHSGKSEAVILIKAAPQVSQKYGETVCCAAVDINGQWLRLYPVSFRLLEDSKKFNRWDRIQFEWERPECDVRPESRHVVQDSIEKVGKLTGSQRTKFLSPIHEGKINSLQNTAVGQYNYSVVEYTFTFFISPLIITKVR